ncbi:hypothetical protein AB4Z38_15370 [Arthrobacter sp. 2RAF6]
MSAGAMISPADAGVSRNPANIRYVGGETVRRYELLDNQLDSTPDQGCP